ncbi:hypothetical protein [Rhodococcus rhodnii]|uniref:Uncharacterized protein n=1 Tax=Rhodococcus rhodnii LMG 5362 TaxID=1273125 RepID=R7WV77_9NOCA|nr:hypothetical protein [Rhodococcus rhodnii]EOM78054.1 hypothetical protein Rrhod_0595 [Rhodococcus rhodnii LMG 5362]
MPSLEDLIEQALADLRTARARSDRRAIDGCQRILDIRLDQLAHRRGRI